MDFTNVLFLPLLGGYLFFSRFNGTRYSASAFPVQRIIFPAAAIGVLFLIGARLIQKLIEGALEAPDFWLRTVVGGVLPGVAASSVLSAAYVWMRVRRREIPTNSSARIQQEETQAKRLSMRRSIQVSVVALCSLAMSAVLLQERGGYGWNVMAFSFAASLLLLDRLRNHLAEITTWPRTGLQLRMTLAALILAAIASLLVRYAEHAKDWGTTWSHFADLEKLAGMSSTAPVNALTLPALSLLVAVLSLVLGNLIITRAAGSACHATSDKANALKAILTRSVFDYLMIEVTLKNRKTYIGWVHSEPPTVESADGHFTFIPVMSGYRDKDTLKLVITTKYNQIYSAMIEEAKSKNEDLPDLTRFAKVFRTADVECTGEFDPDIYERFQLAVSPASTTSSSTPA